MAGGASPQPQPLRWVVGLAMSGGKAAQVATPAACAAACALGIELRVLARDRPMREQGPLDALLHKVKRGTDPDYWEELARFADAHPEVIMIDPLETVAALADREHMLAPLEGRPGGVILPPQLAVHAAPRGEGEGEALLAAAAALGYPLVCKPMAADGAEGSHDLALITGPGALRSALADAGGGDRGGPGPDPPFVLQRYLSHGPCVYKVYVIGSEVEVVARGTIPSPAPPGAGGGGEIVPLSRVSAAVVPGGGGGGAGGGGGKAASQAPPRDVVDAAVGAIRAALGPLRIFNFDLLACPPPQDPSPGGGGGGGGGRGHGVGPVYAAVDINYFPGISKLKGFEGRLARCLAGALGVPTCGS